MKTSGVSKAPGKLGDMGGVKTQAGRSSVEMKKGCHGLTVFGKPCL